MSKRFRKLPVEVDAIQFVDNPSALEIYNWFQKYRKPTDRLNLSFDSNLSDKEIKAINIPTLEGVMKAVPGDWVIKGVKGEFYPCKPDVFASTYEEVRE